MGTERNAGIEILLRARRLCRPVLGALLLGVALLASPGGCGPAPTGGPTTATVTTVPTGTRPAPSSTLPLAPTATPPAPSHSPLPTLLPGPTPLGTEPEGYPALPADLYFLRQGRLWRWPAGGGSPQALTSPTEPIL